MSRIAAAKAVTQAVKTDCMVCYPASNVIATYFVSFKMKLYCHVALVSHPV